jgi:hypothetical protein
MIGENLKKAEEWFDRAVGMEAKGNQTLTDKCLNSAIEHEKKGLSAGESWEKK